MLQDFHCLGEVKKFFKDRLDNLLFEGCMDQVLRVSKEKQIVVRDYFSTLMRVAYRVTVIMVIPKK